MHLTMYMIWCTILAFQVGYICTCTCQPKFHTFSRNTSIDGRVDVESSFDILGPISENVMELYIFKFISNKLHSDES